MSVFEQVQKTIHQHELIPQGSKLVLGVSGGADSLTLLHILQRLSTKLALQLHVASLDHGLRGGAGAEDLEFVVQTCAEWDIPVTTRTLMASDLPAASENAARAARYQFLAEVAHQVGARRVVVAHHADDQAETVLMRLIRGTGLRGLAAMAYSAALPGDPDLMLLRPLLDVNRQDIEQYCQEQGLEPRQDHTNQDSEILRNRLRLEILPQLRQMNPQIDRALVNLSASAALDADYMQGQLIKSLNGRVELRENAVLIPYHVFGELHPSLRQHYILWAAAQLHHRENIGYEHVVRAVTLALEGHTGQRLPLPGGLLLRLDYETVILEIPNQAEFDTAWPLLPEGQQIRVQMPGSTPLPGGLWALESSYSPLSEPQARLSIEPDQVVILRTRLAGDRFMPLGLDGHSQKLKKWLIDHKVPQSIRDQIPLLVVGGEIAAFFVHNRWVTGEHFAGQEAAQTLTHFQFVKQDNRST